MTKDINGRLAWLERWARLLDAQYRIPILNIRIGLDSIFGLIPVIGDFISVILSLIWIYHASSFDIGKRRITLMLLRVVLDFTVSSVPVLGDIFDIFYKANQKNFQSLQEALQMHKKEM